MYLHISNYNDNENDTSLIEGLHAEFLVYLWNLNQSVGEGSIA